jgi:hypothetical protein
MEQSTTSETTVETGPGQFSILLVFSGPEKNRNIFLLIFANLFYVLSNQHSNLKLRAIIIPKFPIFFYLGCASKRLISKETAVELYSNNFKAINN